ncbi:MAG: alpha/beta fold hydrolase [Candidatus Baltobacteraceae bacterium]
MLLSNLFLAAAIGIGTHAPAQIHAGSLTLQPCPDAPGYFCGTIARPLDPSGAVAGTVNVGFTYLLRRDAAAPSAGTIVAAEGGPGYPSGASRESYRALFGPLLRTRDMVLMDDRGTGRSGAIDCEPLQSAPVVLLRDVTRCGAALGARADLYGTGLAADDLNALLDALGIRDADLYGDSYGTFFVQVFAARHPSRVRSVSLDGAYPAVGDDPWYPKTAPAIREAFDRVCRRSPQCNAQSGTTLSRIARLVRELRRPQASVTPTQLAFVMDSAGLNAIAYRELDAAARAYVSGDTAPLVRLVREAYRYEERDPGGVREHSQGLFAAASCEDNPQTYDMRLGPAERERAWLTELARKRASDPELYAPFTIDEFLAIPLDFAYVQMCQRWPVASAAHPTGSSVPTGASMPAVPTLVLTGDLDTITTPSEGDAAAVLFTNAHRVIVSNSGHVTAVGDVYDCASRMVRTLIDSHRVDPRCAGAIPPMRLVPSFSRTLAEVEPASASRGNRAGLSALRAAASAAYAANDALARSSILGIVHGRGLRGGQFTASNSGGTTRIDLRDVAWTSDLPVSGTISFDSATGNANATLHITGSAVGTINATWQIYRAQPRSTITGTIDGDFVNATIATL